MKRRDFCIQIVGVAAAGKLLHSKDNRTVFPQPKEPSSDLPPEAQTPNDEPGFVDDSLDITISDISNDGNGDYSTLHDWLQAVEDGYVRGRRRGIRARIRGKV